jgi:hypothetical protein
MGIVQYFPLNWIKGQTHLSIFSSLRTHRAHIFRNCIAILLSARINSSNHCSCFCRNLNRAACSDIIRDFRTSLREFRDPVVNSGNRTLLFCSTFLKHGRHFDYWNKPLNLRMRVCYLYCHEDGLCCYLVIYTENLLGPLQLFYFHL